MMSIFTSFIRKSSEALRSKTRNEQRLSRVTLNLGMFSEVMRNRFAKDTHLLHVESVLSLALLVDYLSGQAYVHMHGVPTAHHDEHIYMHAIQRSTYHAEF